MICRPGKRSATGKKFQKGHGPFVFILENLLWRELPPLSAQQEMQKEIALILQREIKDPRRYDDHRIGCWKCPAIWHTPKVFVTFLNDQDEAAAKTALRPCRKRLVSSAAVG